MAEEKFESRVKPLPKAGLCTINESNLQKQTHIQASEVALHLQKDETLRHRLTASFL